MQEKKILSTKCTPEITLKPEGIIRIAGRSMFGDSAEFSDQVEDWINEYITDPAEITSVDIYLEYLNTLNFKIYYNLLKKISRIKLLDKKFIINWYYDEGDEDILEKGEDLSGVLNIPFNFVIIKDPLITLSDQGTESASKG
jgi:SiaC family regulatory phosphoprotein